MLNCLIFNTGEVLHIVLQCISNCSKENFTGIYLFIYSLAVRQKGPDPVLVGLNPARISVPPGTSKNKDGR